MARLRNLCAVLLALAVLPAAAQVSSTFRCTGNDGKKYYGSTIPAQCIGRPVEQLSPQGTVIRRFDPQANEADRTAKEAEAAKKREEDTLAKEESRRNRALLATYTSEKDIEEARGRALAENDKAIKQIEIRIADVRKRQAGFEKEMEFYQEPKAVAEKAGADKGGADKGGKAKPAETTKKGPKAPPKLLEDMHQAEVDLAAQENLLAGKRK